MERTPCPVCYVCFLGKNVGFSTRKYMNFRSSNACLFLCGVFQQAEDLESGFSSDVESKYKKIYEDDINPFAAFSKKVWQCLLSGEILKFLGKDLFL